MDPISRQKLDTVFNQLRSGQLAGVAAEPQNKTQFSSKYFRWDYQVGESIRQSSTLKKGLMRTGLVLGTVTGILPLYLAIKGKFTRYVNPVTLGNEHSPSFISQVTRSQWKSLSHFSKSAQETHANPAKDRILRANAMKLINCRKDARELQGLLKQCSTRQLCQLARGIGKEVEVKGEDGNYQLNWSPVVFEELRNVQREMPSPLLDEPILKAFDDYEAHKARAQERVRFDAPLQASVLVPAGELQAQPAPPDLKAPLRVQELQSIRGLAAELLLPANLARASDLLQGGDKNMSATRLLLREYSQALALLCARPDGAAGAQLPQGLGKALQQALGLPGPLAAVPPPTEAQWQDHLQQVQNRIDGLNLAQAQSLSQSMDELVDGFDFTPYSEQLQAVETGMKGPAGSFFEEVFRDYFKLQPAMDRRSMLASLLRQSLPSNSADDQLAALLKGAGPFMHKVLQLFCDTVKNESTKTALSSVKTGLTPIDRELKAAMLERIVQNSGGRIESLSGVRTLGAASVGEALLADVQEAPGPDGQAVSRRVVIKLLRPGIVERAQRERIFFAQAASHHRGMGPTFAGIAEQIEAEMNLQTEASNVQRGQVYNGRAPGLQAMKLSSLVPPQPDSMVVEQAPGSPLQKYIDLCEKAARGEHVPNFDALAHGRKAAEQVAELGRVWMNQALTGDGFFHGDLHAGNLMFDADSGMLTAIDFGNAATIDPSQLQVAIRLGMALQRGHPRLFEREFRKLLPPKSEKLAWSHDEEIIKKITSIMRRADLGENEKLANILSAYTQAGIEVPAVISNFSRSMMMLKETLNRLNKANAINHLRADPQSMALMAHRDELVARYPAQAGDAERTRLDKQIDEIDKRLGDFELPKDVSLGKAFSRALRPAAATLAWRAGLGFTARIARAGLQEMSPQDLEIFELREELADKNDLVRALQNEGRDARKYIRERDELQRRLDGLLAAHQSAPAVPA